MAALYTQVRDATDPAGAWITWRRGRDELLRSHRQSPIPEPARASFPGLPYFDYDPAYRVRADIEPAEPERRHIPSSDGSDHVFTRFAAARFALHGRSHGIELYWLEDYAGGIFLSFRDKTSGRETYGAGRYLLDTAKGADLGTDERRLILDFNFAYNPSCSYDARWVCPLASPANHLHVPVRAGERTTARSEGGP